MVKCSSEHDVKSSAPASDAYSPQLSAKQSLLTADNIKVCVESWNGFCWLPNAWFPALRFWSSQIPLLPEKSGAKFRSVRAVNGKNLPFPFVHWNRIDSYFLRWSVTAQPISNAHSVMH